MSETKPAKKRALPARHALEEAMNAEKVKALSSNFDPTPSNEWIGTKAWWTTATDEQKRDMVYGLTAYSAAKPKLIAKYFSIKEADLKPYQEQLSMGEAARVLKINEHQMRWALSTNQPHAKFFLGLQFAGQVQNPQHEDAPSLDEKKENAITIKVIGRDTAAEEAGTEPFERIGTQGGPVRLVQ